MAGGVKRLGFLGLILAIVPTWASESDRFKRNALYGGFGGYGAGPHPGGYPEAMVPAVPAIPAVPAVPVAPVAPMAVAPAGPGSCPGGPSLGKACDAKRPWPQCPPHSYCFAVNSVDIGPYYCCPVWSTIGAQWRPAAPFYPYYPPMPYNWPYIIQATAHWGAQTSPAAGWLGQFGPAPGAAGAAGGAFVAPAVPDAPVPFGPFDKARKKDPEAVKPEEAAEKEKSESS